MSKPDRTSSAASTTEFVPKHEIEACFNNGWDDAPAWNIVCDCTWEAWDQPSEREARRVQQLHAASEKSRVCVDAGDDEGALRAWREYADAD